MTDPRAAAAAIHARVAQDVTGRRDLWQRLMTDTRRRVPKARDQLREVIHGVIWDALENLPAPTPPPPPKRAPQLAIGMTPERSRDNMPRIKQVLSEADPDVGATYRQRRADVFFAGHPDWPRETYQKFFDQGWQRTFAGFVNAKGAAPGTFALRCIRAGMGAARLWASANADKAG